MNKFGVAFGALSLIVLTGGCAPELDQSGFNQTEETWVGVVKDSYPSWKPTQRTPEVRSTDGKEVHFSSETILPPPPPPSSGPIITGPGPDSVVTDAIPGAAPAGKAVATPAGEKRMETYVSQKGDSLWTIAQKFYKNGNSWTRIRDANKDVLPDPKKLKEGTKLQIPLP